MCVLSVCVCVCTELDLNTYLKYVPLNQEMTSRGTSTSIKALAVASRTSGDLDACTKKSLSVQ